jgi:hypothetical protein
MTVTSPDTIVDLFHRWESLTTELATSGRRIDYATDAAIAECYDLMGRAPAVELPDVTRKVYLLHEIVRGLTRGVNCAESRLAAAVVRDMERLGGAP